MWRRAHAGRWVIAVRTGKRQDTVQMYLGDIEGTPLLTHEETLALSRRVLAGDAEAKQKFVKSNLRLVVSVAKGFQRKLENTSLSMIDLINEGNLGLIKAVERFDPDEGTRFSTYAVWWIKQAIRKALMNQGRPIRLPSHMHEMLSRYRRTEALITVEFGRRATIDEVVARMQVSEDQAEMIRRALKKVDSTETVPEGNNRNTTIAERLPDERVTTPADEAVRKEELGQLGPLLGRLSPRELDVIQRFYGLIGQRQSYREIGRELGLTRERARQIHDQALQRLMQYAGRNGDN